MHPRAQAFTERAKTEYDSDADVYEFPEGTKTAVEAADAVGCAVAQIASSLVFSTPEPVMVVTSGANRVSEAKLAGLCGVGEDDIEMADAAAVRETIGWSIGGVPPFCHDTAVPVYLDETLLNFETVWAAAGTPEAVFPIAPERLRAFAAARPADVTE